jgi:glycosidase
VYGVVVRNFGNGRFQDVIERLDDLDDLGVAALWLAPVTKTPPGCFGYEVTDYFDVRPEYGTLADFRRLVDEAHVRGLRVLLDFVPNHTSSEHPWFRHAERHGAASPYYDYFDRDETGAATHYFDWTHLPNLNFDNPDVRRFMTEALKFWVREMDVDGFRLDVAWGIRQRRPDYWPEFATEFRRAKPDGLLIAEASARDSWYLDNGFDAAYDWTDKLGAWAWADVFTGSEPVGDAIRRALTADGRYDPASLVLRFLNNNDTGPRFISTHGVGMYRVASAMLLSLPGLPCVYTGDEVGAEFEPYATAGEIDLNDRHDLRGHFRKLVRLRRELPGLRSRNWAPVSVEPASDLFAYIRRGDSGASPVLVMLNFGGGEINASIDAAIFDSIFAGSTSLSDIYNDVTVDAQQVGGTIPMSAWGIRVLVAA